MPKFDMGAAWDDSMNLLRSHSALTGTIAAVFLFLPTLAVGWFGPAPIVPAEGATLDQIMTTFQASAWQAIPYQILVAVIAAIGGVGILRLWLSRTGITVGEALVFAIRMIPTMIAIQLIIGFALGFVAVLLVMPGVAAGGGAIGALLLFVGLSLLAGLSAYFWGRLAVVSPIVADRSVYDPVAAIRESLALTKGNGWRIALFLFLVIIVILIIAAIVGGVVAAVAGTGEGFGRLLGGVVEGLAAAVSGLITAAITAATYRQLAVRGSEDIFG